MRTLYYPEPISDWEFTLLQTGGALPVYSGLAYQRGHGIGSFFRGIFRAIWPTLKRVGVAAGKEAIRAGSEAARDHFSEGVDAKTALKRRGKQAIGRTMVRFGEDLQKGEGVGKRPARKNIKGVKHRRSKRQKRRAVNDIFSYG